MNVALITAAGTGSRMHQEIPKQFLHVYDKPVLVYTLEAFQKHPGIEGVCVVTLAAWEPVLWAYAKQYGITKLKWVAHGGSTGHESIRNGLEALRAGLEPDDVVMVHDGNRPLVSSEIISDSLATFEKYGNAVAAIPCTEVVFESGDGVSSCTSQERERLFRTQTPHTYRLGELYEAHVRAEGLGEKNFAASCMLMKELGIPSYFSRGSEENLKITTQEDLRIFRALLRMRDGAAE